MLRLLLILSILIAICNSSRIANDEKTFEASKPFIVNSDHDDHDDWNLLSIWIDEHEIRDGLRLWNTWVSVWTNKTVKDSTRTGYGMDDLKSNKYFRTANKDGMGIENQRGRLREDESFSKYQNVDSGIPVPGSNNCSDVGVVVEKFAYRVSH